MSVVTIEESFAISPIGRPFHCYHGSNEVYILFDWGIRGRFDYMRNREKTSTITHIFPENSWRSLPHFLPRFLDEIVWVNSYFICILPWEGHIALHPTIHNVCSELSVLCLLSSFRFSWVFSQNEYYSHYNIRWLYVYLSVRSRTWSLLSPSLLRIHFPKIRASR